MAEESTRTENPQNTEKKWLRGMDIITEDGDLYRKLITGRDKNQPPNNNGDLRRLCPFR